MTFPRCCAFVAVLWIFNAPVAEAQCSYNIIQTTFSAPSTSSAQSTSVITGTSCSWTVTTSASWITFTSATTQTGIGTVSFVVAPNTGGARTATLTVAGQTLTVSQAAGSCGYTVTPTSFSIDAPSSSRTLSVTTGTQCTWSAATTETWITITDPGTGVGINPVTFSVTMNTAGTSRVGTLTVAGKTVTVTQLGVGGGAGTPPPPPPSNMRIKR